MHSGTTMLHQLIKAHPQVGWIENEECYIEYDKPKEWVLMFAKKKVENLKTHAWGEKIPWGHRESDAKGKRIIKIISKWLEYFPHQARVLHILRHPLDVALSGQGSNLVLPDFEKIIDSVPNVIDFINKCGKTCATVVYEDLLTNPHSHLRNIFDFLNLASSNKIIKTVMSNPSLKFEGINANRAFAHRLKNIDLKIDYKVFTDPIERRL